MRLKNEGFTTLCIENSPKKKPKHILIAYQRQNISVLGLS